MEKANKDDIHIYEIHHSINPKVVLIHSDGEIILANASEVNHDLHMAMMDKDNVQGQSNCPECGTELQNSPDGPWCKTCHPDAPLKFHLEESNVNNR